MSTDAITLDSFLHVPGHLVPLNALNEFKVRIPDPNADPHDEESDGMLETQFFDYDTTAHSYRFARGNMGLIEKHFGHLNITDRRAVVPMICAQVDTPDGKGLRFTGELRPNQQKAVNYLVNGPGYGQLKAPPRYGKTVVMTATACGLGLKTLFLSHQVDLSKQVLDTFHRFTNVVDLEYSAGRPIVGMVEKWEDLDKFDVCIMRYQKFVHNEDKIEKYKNHFGLVLVDESHMAKADWYSRLVTRLNARYRYGVSGTTEIKSKLHLINNFTLGPVMVEGETDQLPCQVHIVKTGVFVPLRDYGDKRAFFTQLLSYLATHDHRDNLILSYLESYAKAGHYCITVGERVGQLDSLTKQLKARDVEAASFHRKAVPNKTRREKRLEDARLGKITVLNAMRRMTLGLDIPRLTAFFNLLPSANPQNYYQELSRVRTPFDTKQMAFIVDFVDDHAVCYACAQVRRKVYREQGFEIIE